MRNLKFLLVFITCYLLLATTTIAASPSPTSKVATEGAQLNPLQSKIEAIKQEIASKAAAWKTEIDKKLQNKAFIGSVEDKNDSQITLKTKSGNKTIIINEYTLFSGTQITSKKKQFTLKDLKTSDYLAVLGDMDDKGILTAKKIIRLDKPDEDKTQTLWGQIQSSSGSIIIIKNKDGQKKNITTAPNTAFKLGTKDSSIADAKPTKFLTATGSFSQDGTFKARFVYFIPAVGFIKPDKPPAATASASPSNKISLSAKTTKTSFSASVRSLTVSTPRQ